MCARARDGTWDPDFSPIRWAYHFTEGTPLHYTWSVFHDIPGLMACMGGAAAFEKTLDRVFDMPPDFDGSFWKRGCTHEIREMQIAGFGQYAHGNQPIQHMIYLYNYAGAYAKTRKWARAAMDRLYAARPDGYCGDEDNGQTSAWFVWSALGLYPVCPGSDEYALGHPLFDRIRVARPGAAALTLRTASAPHASGCFWRGEALARPFVRRSALQGGGELVFVPLRP
jgi:predicted alpha-1,2-mannosidase